MLLASVYSRHKYYNELVFIFLVAAVLIVIYLDNLGPVAANDEAPLIAVEDFIAKYKQDSISSELSDDGLKTTISKIFVEAKKACQECSKITEAVDR